MPLVTSEKMLKDALRDHYAVGAFNAENMEMVQGIIAAAEELKSPVIIQTTPGTIQYASLKYYRAIVSAGAEQSPVPIALHLDHGSSFELASRAYREGYTSIMIDGSKLPFEENIAFTRKVVEMCRAGGVPVEGELGRVGGKEDDTAAAGDIYTEPDQAVQFVEKTAVTSLAVAIGTAHGFYKEKPALNYDLLTKVRGLLKIPLVLHGASGLTDGQGTECVRRGINKVNFATELRDAFSKGVEQALRESPEAFDPKSYNASGRERVKEIVKHKIQLCGSKNKAE